MAQRHVGKNHVGRHVPRIGQFLAQFAQTFEQPRIARDIAAAGGGRGPRGVQRTREHDGLAVFQFLHPILADRDSGKIVIAGGQQAGPQQLPTEIHPVRSRLIFADAMGAERVVFPALDLFRHSAGQNFRHVVEADVEVPHLANPKNAA